MSEEENDGPTSPSANDIKKAFPRLGSMKAKELADALEKATESDDIESIDEAMEKANEILGGHGVSSAQEDGTHVDRYWRDTVLLYVNLGDTYDTTILYDTEEDEFSIGSWGDFIEAREGDGEQDDEEEEGEDEEDSEEEEEEEDDSESEEEE